MVLVLTALEPLGQPREFSFYVDKLEVGFQFLSTLVAQGGILIRVELLEQDRSTQLPVDVFDGTSFITAIQQLEKEWQSVLSRVSPLAESGRQPELLDWCQQQVNWYQQQIAEIQQMVVVLSQLSRESEDFFSFRPKSPRISAHFDSVLKRYEVRLVQARLNHQLAVNRLTLQMVR